MRFTPGPGRGRALPARSTRATSRGGCSSSLGQSFRFVELANDINDHMPDYVVRRLTVGAEPAVRKAVNGSRILLLGLAYKTNTGDARESPAVMVAERLVEMGADVRAVEPYLEETRAIRGISLVDLTREEVAEADAVVLLTDHDRLDLDLVVAEASYVLDTRFRLSGPNVERL